VSKPTRTFGSCCLGNFPSIESSAAGLNLDAQPADFTDAVRRTGASAFMGLFHGRRLDSWNSIHRKAGKPNRRRTRSCPNAFSSKIPTPSIGFTKQAKFRLGKIHRFT
jgi:hypothetical protein